MIKAIIIDDESLSREIIKAYLKSFPQIEVIEECNDGFEGVKAIAQHQPDLIFLDIQMPKINGFEMLELIEQPPALIFCTAFDEYAIRAFEANAIDYLLKPFAQDRFNKAVQKFIDNHTNQTLPNIATDNAATQYEHSSQNERIVVKNGTKIKIIPVQDILYLESDDDYVKIHTSEGQFLKNKTMGFYEQILDGKQFVRVHRSYLVHIGQITKIDPYKKENHVAVLRNGIQIPISKTGYAKLKTLLGL